MPEARTEYVVPRNPAIPSPPFGDVISSPPLGRDRGGVITGARVRVSGGSAAPPRRSTRARDGALVSFEQGLLCLSTTGSVPWRDALAEIARLAKDSAVDLARDLTLPGEGIMAQAFRQAAAEGFLHELQGPDPRSEQSQALAARLHAGDAAVLPYVDIVQVRSENLWRWSRLRTTDCRVIELETSDGDAQTVRLIGDDVPSADECLARRFDQEFLHVAGAAWSELLDRSELWQFLLGRYKDPSAVPVGRFWDDWKNAIQARMASRRITPAQVASITLARLGPWLGHYRKIPAALERVRAIEAIVQPS
jgi:hypothetical protein